MHISCLRTVRSITCAGSEVWILADDATIYHADDNGCRVVGTKEMRA